MTENQFKVLFIDDEKFIVKAIQRELAYEPYELLVVNTSKEALDLLVRNEIAVIAIDLMMPIIGGIELLEIVKKDFPETIRVIFSGAADRSTLHKSIEDGVATAYFIKPFDWAKDVKPKIKELLGYYQLEIKSRSLRNTLIQVMELSTDGFILFSSTGSIPS